MTTPADAAIEAAARALYELEPWQIASYSNDTYAWKALTPGDRSNFYREATAALTAAAPIIAAQANAEALRDAADYIMEWSDVGADESVSPHDAAEFLRARAAGIEAGK